MARNFNGAFDRIDYSSVFDPKGDDITMAAWVYNETLAWTEYWICIQNTGDTNFGLVAANDLGAIQCIRNWSTSYASFERDGAGGISTGTWEHMCLTTNAAGQGTSGMEVYVNGSTPATPASQNGSGTEDAHGGSWSLGGRIYDDTKCFTGDLAEVGVWDRILDAGEIAALAKGYAPSFFLRGLRYYVPLLGSNGVDRMEGKTPTYDGTSVTDHPPQIIYPD
jgi:hypothetical protein